MTSDHDLVDRHGPWSTRPWMICEMSMRWTHAARRFCDEMMPDGLVASIDTLDADDVAAGEVVAIAGGVPAALVIWDLASLHSMTGGMGIVLDQIIAAANVSESLLQLAVVPDPITETRLGLAELGVQALLEHPEDLRRWTHLVQGHFARSIGNLD